MSVGNPAIRAHRMRVGPEALRRRLSAVMPIDSTSVLGVNSSG